MHLDPPTEQLPVTYLSRWRDTPQHENASGVEVSFAQGRRSPIEARLPIDASSAW
jgi:hypothetical protein